jgi:hypothetical protein
LKDNSVQWFIDANERIKHIHDEEKRSLFCWWAAIFVSVVTEITYNTVQQNVLFSSRKSHDVNENEINDLEFQKLYLSKSRKYHYKIQSRFKVVSNFWRQIEKWIHNAGYAGSEQSRIRIDWWVNRENSLNSLIVLFVSALISLSIEISRDSLNFIDIERLLRAYLERTFSSSWQLKSDSKQYENMIKTSSIEIIESQTDFRNLWQHQIKQEISHLRLQSASRSFQSYEFSNIEFLYSYRDRDSSWRNNSCAVDCCSVIARLLNLELTIQDKENVDRKSDWEFYLNCKNHFFV